MLTSLKTSNQEFETKWINGGFQPVEIVKFNGFKLVGIMESGRMVFCIFGLHNGNWMQNGFEFSERFVQRAVNRFWNVAMEK